MMTINLQQQAFQAIRSQIIHSELAPGSKISEKELEERLQIGRTPIREALIQLRNQELIYTIPQSGTYISQIDIQSSANARYTREVLEKAVLQECSAKLTADGRKILETILNQQEATALKRNKKEFFHWDNTFHKTCFELAGKGDIWTWLENYSVHLDRFRWLRVNIVDWSWERLINEHSMIFQAMIDHDLDEISFLTSLHLHMIIEEQDSIIDKYPDYFTGV
ncbi:GntR family transcriptional regulator [Enterococcus sp. LJL90]